MKKSILALLITFCVYQAALAGVVTFEPGNKEVEGVKVSKSAVAVIENRESRVDLLGAGLRAKKFPIIGSINVYVGQLLGDGSKFQREKEVEFFGLETMNTIIMQWEFVRDVDSNKLQTGFVDGFIANKIETSQPHIKQFLEAVAAGGNVLAHKTLTVVAEQVLDGDIVTYEDNNGKATTIHGPKGFAKNIVSLWMGNSSDSGVKDFKNQLLAP